MIYNKGKHITSREC